MLTRTRCRTWVGEVPDPQVVAFPVRATRSPRAARLTHDLLEWRAKLPALRDSRRADVAIEVDERKGPAPPAEEPYRSDHANDVVRAGFVELSLPPSTVRLYRAVV